MINTSAKYNNNALRTPIASNIDKRRRYGLAKLRPAAIARSRISINPMPKSSENSGYDFDSKNSLVA